MQELGDIIIQMLLSKLLFFYRQKGLILLLFSILGLFVGIAYYYLVPPKYIATGSFYIARRIETVPSEFSYEGYYASLASLNYSKTLIALIESHDLKSKVLDGLKQEVTRKGLRDLDRAIDVLNTDSSLVTFQVRHQNPAQAKEIWKLMSEEVLLVTSTINRNGDSKVIPVEVLSEPVIYKGFSNLYFNAVLGLILGLFVGFSLLSSYFYIRENNV